VDSGGMFDIDGLIDRRPFVHLSQSAVGSWLLRSPPVTVPTGYRVPATGV